MPGYTLCSQAPSAPAQGAFATLKPPGQATQEMQFWFVQAQADCEPGSLLVALMLQAGITDCHSPASFSDPDPRLGLS